MRTAALISLFLTALLPVAAQPTCINSSDDSTSEIIITCLASGDEIEKSPDSKLFDTNTDYTYHANLKTGSDGVLLFLTLKSNAPIERHPTAHALVDGERMQFPLSTSPSETEEFYSVIYSMPIKVNQLRKISESSVFRIQIGTDIIDLSATVNAIPTLMNKVKSVYDQL